MKKTTGKTILLLSLAVVLCIPSILILVFYIHMWVASIFGFAAAIFIVILTFVKNKKTYTTELTIMSVEPSETNVTCANCQLNGSHFRLAIPSKVRKADDIVAGAKYKVDYQAFDNVDYTTCGRAVRIKEMD